MLVGILESTFNLAEKLKRVFLNTRVPVTGPGKHKYMGLSKMFQTSKGKNGEPRVPVWFLGTLQLFEEVLNV